MNKKASMMSLLIVALVALGLMAFVSLNGVTGEFSAPKPPKPSMGPAGPGPAGPAGGAIKRPVIVDRGIDTVVVEDDYDESYPVYDSPALSVYDCTIARETKSIKDKLQMVMSDDLVNMVNKCNSLNIY
jgi:hypothetical protein